MRNTAEIIFFNNLFFIFSDRLDGLRLTIIFKN